MENLYDIIHRLKVAGVSIGTRKILFEKFCTLREGDLVKLKPSFSENFKHITGTITSIDRYGDDGIIIEWHEEYENPCIPMAFCFSDLIRVKK